MVNYTTYPVPDSKNQYSSEAKCISCKQNSNGQPPEEYAGHSFGYKTGAVLAVVVACVVSAAYMRLTTVRGSMVLGPSGLPSLPSYQLDPVIANNLGAYSARYEVSSNIPSKIPEGCEVAMINILQRHGARYPTVKAGKSINATLKKVRNAKNVTNPLLEFAPNYQFHYISEKLVPFGQNQSYISGQIIAKQYPRLCSSNFVRSAPKERIVESSRWWRQGFEGGPFGVAVSKLPQPNLILDGKNSTLNVTTRAAEDKLRPRRGDAAANEWISIYAPNITTRLNKFLPDANLNDVDTVNLMSLCGFDTAARDGDPSPWCKVFTEHEFEKYEYSEDLAEYYDNSYGSECGPSKGVGWVNELLSRLTGEPVHDDTTTNHTLDDNMNTFPYGPSGPKIFADFSSDNNIVKMVSAMGIFNDSIPLPTTGILSNRQFHVSKIVPFAGSMTVEKLYCSAQDATMKTGHYVRVLVNSAVVRLDFSSCGDLGTTLGMCPLDGFVESQKFARTGGKWNECFGNN